MYPRVHVLDIGYQYCDTTDWHRASWLVYNGRAEALASDRTICLRPGLFLPRVIRLLKAIRRKYRAGVPFNRENLFVRDGYRCRYCGETGTKATLTFDHVLPESRGGEDTWENAVTACKPCNNRKDNRTPHEAGMPFFDRGYRPHRPTITEFFILKLRAEGISGIFGTLETDTL